MAQRKFDGDGWLDGNDSNVQCNGDSTAMDGGMAMDGIGQRNGLIPQRNQIGLTKHYFIGVEGFLKFGEVVLCLPHHFPKL